MSNRQIKPIVRINDLIELHGDTFSHCEGCATCTEIRSLGKGMEQTPEQRYVHILAKGQDMTKNEIKLMLDNGVNRRRILKSLKISTTDFHEMLTNYGFTKSQMAKGDDYMKVSKEKYDDLKAKGLSDKKIAVKVGVSAVTIHNYKKMWKQEDQQTEYQDLKRQVQTAAATDPNIVKALELRIAELEEQANGYPALMERAGKLESQNVNLQENLDKEMLRSFQLKSDLEKAHAEIKDLESAAEDLENESGRSLEEKQELLIQISEWEEKARLYARENELMTVSYKEIQEILKKSKAECKAAREYIKVAI